MEEQVEFEETKEGQEGGFVSRARLPKEGEFIGIVVRRFGGNRMEVKTTDGKVRNCRVPGRFKRNMWLKEGDFVIIMPWSDDKKGDIIYKYSFSAINFLRKKGLLGNLE